MTLAEKIGADYVAAYKNRDTVRVGVLRLLKTAISNRLVELKQPGGALDDDEIMQLLLRQAKQRKDSIQQFSDAGRQDLAEKESGELAVLEEYLPRPLEEAELAAAIDAAIAQTNAAAPQDMGKVIGHIMASYKGRVDGNRVSALVRQKLATKN